MTTTTTYNPFRNALVELTTPEAFRWYGTQAKATAALAYMIALRSFTTAQRLLNDRKSVAIASAIEEPETVEGDCPKHFSGLRIGNTPEEQLELNQPAIDLIQHWLETDKISVAEPEQADVGWEAIALSEASTIASEPEQNDSECDYLALDELESAIAPPQEYAQIEAQPEPGLENAIADDGEADADLAWVDNVPLEDDANDTELRYWAGDELE